MPRVFTLEEQAYLASLPAVASVNETTITYADEFRTACMDRYYAGESPTAIFRSEGLNPELIGAKRIERCMARWRRSMPRPETPAPPRRDLKTQNRVLRTKVAVLERLSELTHALEKHSVPKSRRFELIDQLRGEMDDFSVSAACEELGVSEGGYYHWRAHRAATDALVEQADGVGLDALAVDVSAGGAAEDDAAEDNAGALDVEAHDAGGASAARAV